VSASGRSGSGRAGGGFAVGEAGGPERVEQRVRRVAHHLVGDQLTRNKAEGRTAVGEGDVIALDLLEDTQHWVPVSWDGLERDSAGLAREARIALQQVDRSVVTYFESPPTPGKLCPKALGADREPVR
jgi:hypothetical protein